MVSLQENIKYREFIICPNCSSQVSYHVTDIKGVDEKFIVCPECHAKIYIK